MEKFNNDRYTWVVFLIIFFCLFFYIFMYEDYFFYSSFWPLKTPFYCKLLFYFVLIVILIFLLYKIKSFIFKK